MTLEIMMYFAIFNFHALYYSRSGRVLWFQWEDKCHFGANLLLPVVVDQSDKRRKQNRSVWSGMTDTEHKGSYARRRYSKVKSI